MVARQSNKGSDADSTKFRLFDTPASTEADVEDELPKDEAGRAKIKQQYVELLGIRVNKLGGRVLNRERINKTLEGVYFICSRCQRVCHNLDDGLVEDEENANNLCVACDKELRRPAKAPASKAKKAAKKSTPKKSERKAGAASSKKG